MAIRANSLLGTSAGKLDKRLIKHNISRLLNLVELTLVTDLVPSEIACLANSPGRISRTAVWISREEMVDFLEYEASSTRVTRLEHRRKAKAQLRLT